MKIMNIGIVSNNYPPEILGGAEICASQLSNEISQYYNLLVFAGRYHLERRLSNYEITRYQENFPVYRIELGSIALDYRNPLNFFNPFVEFKFRNIAEIKNLELLHAHNLAGISLSPIAYSKKNLKIPIVMTLHDFWMICPKNTLLTNEGNLCEYGGIRGCNGCNLYLLSPFSKLSMNFRNNIVSNLSKNIDLFISPSKKLMDILLERGYNLDIRHVENGLELQDFVSIERDGDKLVDDFKILMLSYIAYHKGVYTLIDALETLAYRGYKNVKVLLAGSLENENQLREYIKNKNISNQINILGKISESRKLEVLREADIFVLPSLWYENQPLTIIEAMASGLPVIGSNVGGIPEMVIDGETGYLFERGDGNDLASKIEELILDGRKLRSFGKRGRETAVKHYDIQKNAQKIMKIYEEL
jgi:glycosyltransferase involved in cell wall biosynthesis